MGLTRGVDPDLLSVLAGHFHPVLLTEASWPGGTVRVHSGAGTLSWAAQSWTGLGRFGGWEIPAEEAGLVAGDASVRIAGTLEAVLAEKGTDIRNRAVSVWFGATTTAGGNVLVAGAAPCLLFSGHFAGREFRFAQRSDTELAHDLVLGLGLGPSARAKASLVHSYEDQVAAHPGDTAGRHLQNLAKKAANPPQWPEP